PGLGPTAHAISPYPCACRLNWRARRRRMGAARLPETGLANSSNFADNSPQSPGRSEPGICFESTNLLFKHKKIRQHVRFALAGRHGTAGTPDTRRSITGSVFFTFG